MDWRKQCFLYQSRHSGFSTLAATGVCPLVDCGAVFDVASAAIRNREWKL